MWNERFSCEEFAYGTEPNDFLAQNTDHLQSPILSLAEGEGRNAVYLASKGFDVLGVDNSDVGLLKAERFAESKGLSILTEVADLGSYVPPVNQFGTVISIFAHLSSDFRKRLYPLVVESLQAGGIFLLEGYSKAQIGKDTGGPKNPDLLFSSSELEGVFSGFDIILSHEIDREVIEGKFHTGLASVVQFIARKPD